MCGVLTERASKAYTGATYENQSGPRQTQSSDLARLTEWCWTNFFHVSSELARPISLGAWHLAPSTVQQRVTGPALLRRWGQGPGCGGRAQTEPTEHSSSPRSALGLGNRGAHCLGLTWPVLAAIHREESPSSQGEGKKKDNSCQLWSAACRSFSPSSHNVCKHLVQTQPREAQYSRFKGLRKRAGKGRNAPFDADAISMHQAGITKHNTFPVWSIIYFSISAHA